MLEPLLMKFSRFQAVRRNVQCGAFFGVFANLIFLFLFAETESSAQVPAITDLKPSAGQPGDFIAIEGRDFDRISSNNAVFFGGVKAFVKEAAVGGLRVQVPRGVQGGDVIVTVGGFTAVSPIPFRPLFPPFGSGTNSWYAVRPAIVENGHFLNVFASADFDGDGDAELVAVTSDQHLKIYSYEGGASLISTNSFRKRVNLVLWDAPRHIVPMDYDADGRIDLVILGPAGFTIVRNVHSGGPLFEGSFDSAIHYLIPLNPSVVRVGDLDDDGRLDLATLSPGNMMRLYKNVFDSRGGAKPFASPVGLLLPGSRNGLALGDLNRDGKVELIVSSSGAISGPSLTIYAHRDRSGVLLQDSYLETSFRVPGASSVAVADVEGDGYSDIVVNALGTSTSETSVLFNQTRGGEILTNLFPRIIMSSRLSGVQGFSPVFDFDGDGRPDLVSGWNRFLPNRTAQMPGVVSSDSFSSIAERFSLAAQALVLPADVNGDGLPDFILTPEGSTVSVIENMGDAPITLLSTGSPKHSFRIKATAPPGQPIPLEISFDLRHWNPMSGVVADDGGEATVLSQFPGFEAYRLRFFRIRSDGTQ